MKEIANLKKRNITNLEDLKPEERDQLFNAHRISLIN